MSAQAVFQFCAGMLALFCAIGLARVTAIIPLHVPLDPNEGWNAYHTLHAMNGGGLYPAADGFLTNNYPPLSFYIVGTIGWLTGDNIVAGRIVSLLSLLAGAVVMYVSARGLKANPGSAILAVLVFVAGLLVFTDYVGMDDPQMLGHAVSLAGLVVLLNERRDARSAVFAALLMTFAWFIKHNLVALPVAAAIWLAFVDRRAAVWFVTAGLLSGLLGLVLFRFVYGIDLLHVLSSPRVSSLALLTASLKTWLLWANLPLLVLAGYLVLQRPDRETGFCAIYALVAILTGVVFGGGAGVDMNIWFDAMIALSLATAVLVSRFRGWTRPVAAIAYIVPLIAGIVLNWDDAWLERDFWLHPMHNEAATAVGDIAFLKVHNGPALCEMLSLCYWAGKPAEVDVFNLGQAYAARRRSDDSLVALIEAKRYSTVEFDSLDDFALTPRVRQALLKTYRVDHTNDEGVFLVPR